MKKITCGRELQHALEELGVNALWVKRQGIVIMSAYYGVNCSVTGRYPVYTLADGLRLLGELERTSTLRERSDVLWMFEPSSNRGFYEVR